MSRDDQQRYDQALAHVKSVNAGLATEINTKLKPKAAAIGAEISLGGAGYWRSGTAAQHAAVRGLLLCQIAYFRPPHCMTNQAATPVLNATRTTFLRKSLAQVNSAIELYTKSPAASPDSLARAAEEVNQLGGDVDFVTRELGAKNLGNNIICYNGVTAWLFAARMVSKKWLAGPGGQIDANNADRAFGKTQLVDPGSWATIPRGHLWTIQRTNDPTTCHWGLSLGQDKAAATNNTMGSPVLMLDSLKGSSQYGTFQFSEMCKVLNSDFKYGHVGTVVPAAPDTNIVVKTINPATSGALY